MSKLNEVISLNINRLFKEQGKHKSAFCTLYKHNARTFTKMLESVISFDIDTLIDLSKYLDTTIDRLILVENKEYVFQEIKPKQVEESQDKYSSNLLRRIEELSSEIGKLTYKNELLEKEVEKLRQKK